MDTISKEELKQKLDNKEKFKLVYTSSVFGFNSKRIPGSIRVGDPQKVAELLEKQDEIVVYCTGGPCIASLYAYQLLKRNGFTNVRRYEGGTTEWEDSNYPMEGEFAK